MTSPRPRKSSTQLRTLIGTRAFNVVAATLSVMLVVLIAYPLLSMTARQMLPNGQLNTDVMQRVLGDPRFHTAVLNTMVIVVVSGAIALLIGTVFAWFNERTDARMGRFATFLPLIPLVLPPIALSIGWLFLAERTAGIINVTLRYLLGLVGLEVARGPLDIASWYGVLFLYTVWMVPFVYLLIAGALRNVDPSLEEASRVCGASPTRTLFRVSLPAIAPAIGGAAFLVLLLGIAQFSIGRTVGAKAQIDVLTVYLVRLFRSFPAEIDAAVFVGLLVLTVILGAWLVQRWLSRRQGHATIGGRGHSSSLVRLGRWRWVARTAMVVYLGVASILPLIALTTVAIQPYWRPRFDVGSVTLQNFARLFENPYQRGALLNSLRLAIMGATIGMAIAALLVTYARFSGGSAHRIVEGAARSPGAISNVVIAVAFLLAFGGSPFNLAGTLAILLIVYVLMNMPQAWVASEGSMHQVGQDMIDASFTSGATRLRTFYRVNFPLMASGIAAGWAMLFVVMAGDLTASAILAGVRNPVVGFVILDIWDSGTFSQLAALGVIMAAVSGVIIALVLRISARMRVRAEISAPQ